MEGPGLGWPRSDISKRVKWKQVLAAGSGSWCRPSEGSEWGLFAESRNFRGTCAASPFSGCTHSELPILVLFNFFQVKVRGRSGAARFLNLQGVSAESAGQRGRLSCPVLATQQTDPLLSGDRLHTGISKGGALRLEAGVTLGPSPPSPGSFSPPGPDRFRSDEDKTLL